MTAIADKYHMTREDNVFFAKRNIIDSIWKEANVEGIAVTFPQTQEVFEGRVVNGLTVDETVAINNLKHAWQFVFDNLDAEIDLAYIRQVNAIVGAGVIANAGELRMVDVSMGGTTWKPDIPDYDVAKGAISAIAETAPSTDRAVSMMLFLCRSQLFLDGNKRTAQLVANAMLIQGGYGILAVPVDEKMAFSELLVEYYETGDSSKIKAFLAETSLDGFDSAPPTGVAVRERPVPIRDAPDLAHDIRRARQIDQANRTMQPPNIGRNGRTTR